MSITGILKNIKNKGIVWTSKEIARKHVLNNLEEHYYKSFRDKLVYDENIYIDRPFLKYSGSKYNAFMKVLFEKEKELESENPKLLSSMKKEMKALYIKKRIPEVYNSKISLPVENKVICMENGNSPSPSSFHVGKEITKQKKYEVHYTGLKIRKVSEVEYYENALKFIDDLATSKAVFLSTANDLLSYIDVRPETKVIQLWHGVGVFKRVGYSTVNKSFGKNAAEREEYDQYKNYSYVTIPAEEQAWIFEDAMHIPIDSGKLVPVGVSRTDVFFNQKYIDETYKKLYKKFPHIQDKKILLYVPTFRGAVAKAKAPDALDIDKLGEALADEYVLLIKHHGLSKDIPEIPERWKDTFAIDMGEKKILGIERLLAIADICITDYSSVAFEFAIMERPIIFFAYDLEDYIDERGMYYNYEEITPGPVCKTNEEMIDYIVNIDERFDKDEIVAFKNKHVYACDGHATERTIALIEG